jgi:hypothetical protein
MLRGLESVVAVVLLIVVAVVGVVLVYLWFSSYLGKATGAAGQVATAERFKVESASLAADGTVRLYIRNLGGAPVEVKTIYMYREGSQNPLCVKQDVKAVIPPNTLAAVGTRLTCTTSPAPGRNYVVKVVTARGTEIAYTTTTNLLAHGAVVGGGGGGGGGGSGGGGVECSFVAFSGNRFGSPDGSPAKGFNELNSWVAAWGPSGDGVRIALMPGITPPDSTGTGTSYTVELNNVQIGTLVISSVYTSVSIEEPTPDFMEVVRIWLEPGGHVLYDNGAGPVVVLAPGTYQVYATLRVKPRYDVYGNSADLMLRCAGTPAATITLRVPNPDEWGLRADIYTFTTSPPPWPPFGAGYTYRGTWSVGAINWFGIRMPYFSRFERNDSAPKWAAYWIDPAATEWTYWAVRLTGSLYVPWSSIRVGLWHDGGAYVKLCDIDTGNSWWFNSGFNATSGTCPGSGEYSVEIGYYHAYGWVDLRFVIGPGDRDEAYIPTIDGAWYCPNFDWRTTVVRQVRCSTAWSFVPASPAVPHFRGTNYTPSTTVDGGGSPGP